MKNRILAFIALLCFCEASSQITISDSLELYYPFNYITGMNVPDESGKQNHGAAFSVTRIPDRFGESDKALYFNGANSMIYFAADSLMFDTYTYALWVMVDELPPMYDAGFIIDIGSYYGVDQYIAYTNSYSNYILDGVLTQGYNTDGSSSWIGQNDFLEFGVWSFITYTRSNDYIKQYINGEIIDSLNIEGLYPIYGDAPKGNIGCRNSQLQYFKGGIDDVRIYSYALSSETVYELYNETITDIVKNKESGWTIFPNPTNDFLKVQCSEELKPSAIHIMDLTGRTVLRSKYINGIDLRFLPKGVYVVHGLSNEETTIGYDKVIVQ